MATIDQDALSSALSDFFQRDVWQCPDDASVYTVQSDSEDEEPYWSGNLRTERFENTMENGILYRPAIVNEICSEVESVLASKLLKGLMVKGPQGIGKSHSLVNTVLRLESTGDYLVTFIPDCDNWGSSWFLVLQICFSFGLTTVQMSQIGITRQPSSEYKDFIEDLIDRIDGILTQLGKRWVFVFDQINRLFVMPDNLQARDAGSLAFPYKMIQLVRKPGRITSVISASADNEMAYKEHHEGFVEYNHRTNMTGDELCLAFDGIDETNVEEVVDSSGGVPLYALLYIQQRETFQAEISESLLYSLGRLRPRNDHQLPEWKLVLKSIFSSIFGTASSTTRYDKKFLIREEANTAGTLWHYRPLFPAVLAAYREKLWDELMNYVETEEGRLLEVCRSADTSNDTRGRLFKTIVIRRCQSSGVAIWVGDHQMEIGASSDRFAGKLLPRLTATSLDRIYIPFDPNFPAIDLIWKRERSIFGVQVHVSSHDDVASSFLGLCREAGWFQNFDTVHLLYLAPEGAVTNLVCRLAEPSIYEARMLRSIPDDDTAQYRIVRRAISKGSVSCLVDLQWPDGCSL